MYLWYDISNELSVTMVFLKTKWKKILTNLENVLRNKTVLLIDDNTDLLSCLLESNRVKVVLQYYYYIQFHYSSRWA